MGPGSQTTPTPRVGSEVKAKTLSLPTTSKPPSPVAAYGRYDVTELLTCVVANRASDLHIVVERPPIVRIHGDLQAVEGLPVDASGVSDCARQFFAMKGSEGESLRTDNLDKKGSADFAIALALKYKKTESDVTEIEQVARFRVNIAHFNSGLSITARYIPSEIRTLESLQVPPQITKLLDHQRGLILVVGPTGSGKTTTLAAMINHINETRSDKKIITIEDPIEFVHKHKKAVIQQREVPGHVPSFEQGIIHALRQNPDVILVGEMRTKEDMSAALTAAETGHLVFATLHTSGAASTVQRFVGQFNESEQTSVKTQLAMNMIAVVSQLLVPTIDNNGRIAIFEVLVNTPAVAEHIRKDPKHIGNEISTGAKHGMLSFDNTLLLRFNEGVISAETAIEKAYDRESMKTKIAEIRSRGALST